MCNPFQGYRARQLRQPVIASANTSLVEDEYGFRYYLVTEAGKSVDEAIVAGKGHNDTRLTFIRVVSNRGLDIGLYHTDDSWKKRVVGKLVIVREHVYFDHEEFRDKLKITEEVIFEGTRAEARIMEKRHCDDFFKDCSTGAARFARGMSDPFRYRFKETGILPEAPSQG